MAFPDPTGTPTGIPTGDPTGGDVPFAARHIGTTAADQRHMLDVLGYATLDDLLAAAVPASIREKLSLAVPPAASEAEVAAEIRETWNESGYLADPHTAIGIGAARQKLARDPATPMVVLGTAHPAKFPAAVKAACGVEPALPAHLADLMERKERVTELPNDLAAVEKFVREHARAVRGAAA